jgi:glycosyltransferase involved in cell wall biosynthesis
VARFAIEGWRFLAHSYALVNQYQCLEMLRRAELTIYHRDLPFYLPRWVSMRGVLGAADESLLEALPPPPPEPADVTYRIAFPFDLRPSASRRTVVFMTAESHCPPSFIRGGVSIREALAASDVSIVTPSNWSRDRLIQAGAPAERISIVPHGVDTRVYHPAAADARAALRARAGLAENFVFLHVGAMTDNKNIPLLLGAFAQVARKHPHARLLLKGVDHLYGSNDFLSAAIGLLEPRDRAAIEGRIIYYGGIWPVARMAELYHVADAYVTPYACEGFNLPALEAAACGLPLLCTRGGPTDEFTTPNFSLPIDSVLHSCGPDQSALNVNPNSLLEQMSRIVEDDGFRITAGSAGPDFVASRFTWRHIVNQLLSILLPGAKSPVIP